MAEETRLTARTDLPARRTEGLRDPSAAQIRADIEQSRVAMSDTLNQIQERLSPARLKAQAKEKVRDATIGRMNRMAKNVGDRAGNTGRGIVDVMKENPVPLALIGIGAGLLFMKTRRRGRELSDIQLHEGRPSGYQAGSTIEQSTQESAGVTERVGEVAHDVRETVGDAGHTVKDAAISATHRARAVAAKVRHGVSDAAGNVRHRMSDAAGSASHRYEESPWMGGALALALGAAAGLTIPVTDPERRLMGEKRDELVDRVSELGREKLRAVRNVASEVAADARDAVAEAKDSVRESVRTHAREEGLVDSGDSSEGIRLP
jgi:ElaB/YqjD/DUF883 family membrane-anchored ribosome-binding protein